MKWWEELLSNLSWTRELPGPTQICASTNFVMARVCQMLKFSLGKICLKLFKQTQVKWESITINLRWKPMRLIIYSTLQYVGIVQTKWSELCCQAKSDHRLRFRAQHYLHFILNWGNYANSSHHDFTHPDLNFSNLPPWTFSVWRFGTSQNFTQSFDICGKTHSMITLGTIH